jgi:hypothetical protein
VAAPEDVSSAGWLFIQKQLRGTRRFGYRVSKENFHFLDFDDPSMSNPAGLRVFRCVGGITATGATLEKSQRFNRLDRILLVRCDAARDLVQ